MPTKDELVDQLQDATDLCDGVAELLADPDLDDDEARARALEHLGYELPAFLEDVA